MAEELSLDALFSLDRIIWHVKAVGLANLNLSPSDSSLKYFFLVTERNFKAFWGL